MNPKTDTDIFIFCFYRQWSYLTQILSFLVYMTLEKPSDNFSSRRRTMLPYGWKFFVILNQENCQLNRI